MSLKQDVVEYLESEPKFRERKNKDRGIVNLLARRYGVLGYLLKRKEIDIMTVVAIIKDAASIDREWRQTLQFNPPLRGKDYEDKKILEQEKQIELGYEVGYANDVKKLKNL